MKVLAILTLLFGLFLLAPAATLPGLGAGSVSAQVVDVDDVVDDLTGEADDDVDDAADDATEEDDEALDEAEDDLDDVADDSTDALVDESDAAAGTVEDFVEEAQGGGEIFVPAAPESVTSQTTAGDSSFQVIMPPAPPASSQASGVRIIPPNTGDAGMTAATTTEGTSTAAGMVAIALFGLAIALTGRVVR